VTIVAAWIKADTGVGPSIASGNHVCKPIWADFAITPIISITLIQLNMFSKLEKIVRPIKELNFKRPERFHKETIPNNNPTSPTLLTTIAFIAALFACILVYQKLINK